MSLDILYLAANRLEFTQRTFHWMIQHTDWGQVDRLVVYDDASEPKARQWLKEACHFNSPIPCEFRTTQKRSPVGVTIDYLKNGPADWFVKIDNDIALPPNWLNDLLFVREHVAFLDLLGMEAGMTRVRGRDGSDPEEPPQFEPSTHIGGIGLMRSEVFSRPGVKLRANGRHWGFTEWQHRHKDVVRGWITPDLACPLLDRLPFQPYLDLSFRYRDVGWQRDWPTYDPVWMEWAFGWVRDWEEAQAEAV